MFDRFLIYARARRALSQGQFDAALRLVAEPAVATERRAVQIREKALAGMLTRARRRLETGNLEAAAADVDGVLLKDAEFDGAASLRAEIQTAAAEQVDRNRAAQDLRKQARTFAERGDLGAAERACSDAAGIQPEGAEQVSVERFIAGRQRAVADDLVAARSAIAQRDLEKLRGHIARLGAQTDQPAEFAAIARQAMELFTDDHLQQLKQHGESASILDAIAQDRSTCRGLLEAPALAKSLRKLGEQRVAATREQLAANRLREAVTVFCSAHTMLRDLEPMLGLKAGIDALAQGNEAREQGDLGGALEHMRVAATALEGKVLREVVKELQAADRRSVAAVAKSREFASGGQLLAAREQIVLVLEEWPMHEPLRRQMDILNQQTLDREDRLHRGRDLADQARLAEASALLLGLSGDGEEGREARILLKDIQGRMDLAVDGLAQVRRAVHGPSSSREGLRHCVARLDEIAKIQVDLEELQTFRAALTAEIRCLDLLENLSGALESGDVAKAQQEIVEYQAARGDMLRSDRLDARFLDLADRILQRADAGVHNARLFEAAAWVEVVKTAATGESGLESRIQGLDTVIGANQGRALELIGELEQSSRTGDLDDASELLEAARTIWSDCPQLEKIESQMTAMQSHADAVDEVERLTGAGDVRGAHRKLGAMAPTPGFLRTRIFDIKQGLARAQGLEQGFLLRVDEGGEYLVLREDSLTIGNVRDAKADLRLLANVAGLHACFKRSLSFHGGMEDRIVAAKGQVFVNGKQVESAVLRSGDRVRLGSAFEFVYTVPGKRSLTVALHLKAGFQVAGTDKILLMKDRGRDGRILIGRAADAHVRVPHDGPEVELYSASDGQIRVRFAGKGEIGGKPFSGSHPITAGAVVQCEATSFVLQPWHSNTTG